MPKMSEQMFLVLNIATLVFLTIMVATTSLSIIPLVLALSVLIGSLYNIIKFYCFSSRKSLRTFRDSPKKQSNVIEFERKVREAYDKSMYSQAQKCRSEDYYWNKSYLRQPEEIEALRSTPLSEQYRNSLVRKEIVLNRDDVSSAKRVRTFFQQRREDASISNQTKAALLQFMQSFFNKEVIKSSQKSIKVNKLQVENCLKLMEEFINSKIEAQIDTIIEDFEAVEKFMNRCFSVNLTLQRPTSEHMISYTEFKEMIRIIQTKHTVPIRFTTSQSIFQIRQKLAEIRKHINRLPDFSLSANVLKLAIALKHLRKEFSDANIIFADFARDDRMMQGEKHIIRLQDDDRFFYHNEPQIKSKQASVILLLLVIHFFPKYEKSGKYLIKQLSMELGFKYFLK